MALITQGVKLSMKSWDSTDMSEFPTSGFTELKDMQSYGDIMGSVNALDCTTLAHKAHVYVAGLLDNGGSLEFGFLYSAGLLSQLKTVGLPDSGQAVHQAFELEFPDGVKFQFGGYIKPAVDGHGVDEVLTIRAIITMDTDINIAIPSNNTNP